MRKQDLFFIRIFTGTYLLCMLVLGCASLRKELEQFKYAAEEENNLTETEQIEKNKMKEIEGETIFAEKETEPEEALETPLQCEDFSDALFIGDSRTVGLKEYGGIENADFFADSGMSVFRLEKSRLSVSGKGKMSFEEVLTKKQYGKIYFMLGINELGYSFSNIQEKYQEKLKEIREKQSSARIYLCANLHVTKEQSQRDDIYNNANIDKVNAMIAKLADNKTMFYLDVNELFDDKEGFLKTEYSSDSFHVYGKYYKQWVDWIYTKTIKI